MISKVDNIIKTLEKKDKIINYLKSIYKVEVGEEPTIPEAYIDQNLLDDKTLDSDVLNIINSELNKNKNEENEKFIYAKFHEKVVSLRFPSLLDKEVKQKVAKIKKEKEKNRDNKNFYNHIYEMDLSGYGDKEFKIEDLKVVLDTMKIFKTLVSLDLSRNKLDDGYAELLVEFLNFPTLKKINLSFNEITKIGMKKILPVFRSNLHFEYMDLRYNPFCTDENICFNICNSLKNNSNINYFAFCDSSSDASGMKILQHKNKIMKNLILEDCKYKPKVYEILRKALIDKKCTLENLSLKFNTIDVFSANSIEKALRFSKSLIYLNLNNCGISDYSGAKIISSLEHNKSLTEINFSQNKLSNLFCNSFGKVLRSNTKLNKVDISQNIDIFDSDFQFVVECLVDNHSIISLGNLDKSKIGIKLRESVEIILQLNRQFNSKEIDFDSTITEKFTHLRTSMTSMNDRTFEKLIKDAKETQRIREEIKKKEELDKENSEKNDKSKEKYRDGSNGKYSPTRKKKLSEKEIQLINLKKLKMDHDINLQINKSPSKIEKIRRHQEIKEEKEKMENINFDELINKYDIDFNRDDYEDFYFDEQ